MAEITFNLTASEAALMAKMQKAEEATAKVQAKMDKLGATLKKSGEDGKGAFDGVGSSLIGVAAGMGLATSAAGVLNKAVEMIRKTYDEILEKQRLSTEHAMTNAQARNAAIWNKPADISDKQYDRMVKDVRNYSGLDEKSIHQIMGPAMSTKGSVSNETMTDAVKMSALIQSRTNGGIEGSGLVQAIMGTSRATGLPDAKTNLGYFRQLAQSLSASDPDKQAKLLQAIISGSSVGDKAEETGRFGAVASQMMQDKEGRFSVTAVKNFAADLALKDIVPKTKISREGKKETTWEKTPIALQNTEERLKYMQDVYQKAAPETRRDMLAKFAGDAKSMPFFMGAITNSETFQKEKAVATRNISAPSAASAAYADEYLKTTESGVGNAVIMSREQSEKAKESSLESLTAERMAIKASAKRLVTDYNETNPNVTGGWLRNTAFSPVGRMLRGVSSDNPRTIMEEFKSQAFEDVGDIKTGKTTSRIRDAESGEAVKAVLAGLERMIKEWDEINKRQLEAAKIQQDAAGKQNTAAANKSPNAQVE